jgi:hypothetical protein
MSDETRSLQPYILGLNAVPQHARIVSPDWHFFAPAVAVRPDLSFTTGIDPSFTYLASPEIHLLFSMTTTTPFLQPIPLIDSAVWMGQVMARAPGDALVLMRDRHGPLIELLKKQTDLVDLAPNALFTVMRLR